MAPPLDLSHHYASTTKRRQGSGIKDLYKYFFIPGIANLAGGMDGRQSLGSGLSFPCDIH